MCHSKASLIHTEIIMVVENGGLVSLAIGYTLFSLCTSLKVLPVTQG